MNQRDTTVDVMNTRKTMEILFQVFGHITTFVSAIGGISMLVAEVSILNIMMMSVTERIKEIGIMRSIGAQRKEVMVMLLYEAGILGVVDRIIGGLMSLMGGYAISSLMLHTTTYLFFPSSLVHIAYGMTLVSSSNCSAVSTRHGVRLISIQLTHSVMNDLPLFFYFFGHT